MDQRVKLGLAASLALLSFGTAASAADDVGKWYLAPLAFEVYTGKDRAVDDGVAAELAFGKNLSEKWSLELGYNRGSFKARDPADNLTIDAFSFNALRHFYRDSKIHPYYTLGFVESFEKSDNTGRTDRQMAQVGLGLLGRVYTAADHSAIVHIRAEVKERWNLGWASGEKAGKPNDFLAGIGLQFSWGAPAPVPAAAPPAPPPPPPPAAAPPPPPPPPPAAPPPPPPAEVVLKGVNFETASAVLKPESTAVLDGVVANIKKCNCGKVEIHGYTDSVGKPDFNQQLSERRANAVKDYLVAHGIAADLLTAQGFGEDHPIASNATAAGRAENRRVTVQFKELASH